MHDARRRKGGARLRLTADDGSIGNKCQDDELQPDQRAGRPTDRGEAQASDAFSTPSVVHFGVVLLLSAVVSAPWYGIGTVAVLWGLVGLCGIVYSVIVARRLRV